MVGSKASKRVDIQAPIETTDVPEESLRWSSITLGEVLTHESRLEASVFDVEGKHSRELLEEGIYPIVPLCGTGGMAREAFYPGRFKRIYCDETCSGAMGFLGSSEMLDIQPKPVKYMSGEQNDTDKVKVKRDWILLSRSGTIGNVTFVSSTLQRYLVSAHAIRIVCSSYPGYVYTFLRTDTGQALIRSSIYGAVVSQIEPEHLENIPIPDPPLALKSRIHNMIARSYALRDESNALVDKAETLFYEALRLPPLRRLRAQYFGEIPNVRNYSVRLSTLSGRLDASYHVPIVKSVMRRLNNEAAEVTIIGDSQISMRIILPGRFARVYVQEGQGVPFFGGKQLYQLDPVNKKYLSLIHHGERIKEQLALEENMIMITCSGTIGKVALVPSHWKGWTANQHIIRIVPASEIVAGYLCVFLASDYGRELITRFTYGSVVDEIDNHHVAQISVPLLKDKGVQIEINRLVLEANVKRTEAYHLEQEAISLINDKVIYAEEGDRAKMLRKTVTSKKVAEKLSLYPLSPEEALAGFLKVDPKKVKAKEKKSKKPKKVK